MTDLYIRPGADPQPLPFDAYDANGRLWTDLANSEEGREATGWDDLAPAKPADTDTKVAAWDGEKRKWVMVDRPPPPPVDPVDLITLVEVEKVRRIEAGFPFAGKLIQSRAEDRENIAGAKSAAQDAKLLGAEPGELDWQKKLDAQNGAPVFAWITADNSMLPLDADAMIAMGYAAMLHKQRLIFVAKGIKDRIAAGEAIADVTSDALWT